MNTPLCFASLTNTILYTTTRTTTTTNAPIFVVIFTVVVTPISSIGIGTLIKIRWRQAIWLDERLQYCVRLLWMAIRWQRFWLADKRAAKDFLFPVGVSWGTRSVTLTGAGVTVSVWNNGAKLAATERSGQKLGFGVSHSQETTLQKKYETRPPILWLAQVVTDVGD